MSNFHPLLVICLLLLWTSNLAANDSGVIVVITDSGWPYTTGRILRCHLQEELNCSRMASSVRPRYPVYDHVEDYIYWSDYSLDTICRVHWSGENYNHSWINLSGNPSGLAIDPLLRLLFSHDGDLKKIDLRTKEISVIDSLIHRGTITLDTERRKIYIAEREANIISVINYDGSQRATVLSRGLEDPRGIAYSQEENKLYYCDKEGEELGSLDLDTRQISTLYDNGKCLSVSLLDETLYFTNYGDRGKVFYMSTSGGTSSYYSYTGSVSEWMRLTVFRRCTRGWYGRMCDTPCDKCYNGTACSPLTGVCYSGCTPGWQGETCTAACSAGRHGTRCDNTCGQCAGHRPCHHESGVCQDGCKSGWTGDHCRDECPEVQYEPGCQMTCGYCFSGRSCNKNSGKCIGGCMAGWSGIDCKKECQNGTYGPGCLSTCGWCRSGTDCDKILGVCLDGCEPGWMGVKCDTECADGHYGAGCLLTCGLCHADQPCQKTTGACMHGCKFGWTGTVCTGETRMILWMLVAVCGLLGLIVFALTVIIIRTRRHTVPRESKRLVKCGDHQPNFELRKLQGDMVAADDGNADYVNTSHNDRPSSEHIYDMPQGGKN